MAKIDRYNGNLQAPASAALGTERTIFGEVTQSDDLTDQFTPDLLRGWGIVGPSDEPTLQDFNAMGFTLGQLHAYLHQVGVAEYNAMQEYHEDSFTNSGGVLYVSLVDNNIGNDPASSPLQWMASGQQDPLNAAISTVAAAATINLTVGSPDTSQLAISGAGVSINGFTVEANRFFVVKMLAANTLVNSPSLVTNSGASIVTSAGDSFLMRATAANTVEILCFTKAVSQSLGDGQTVQTLTGSRAFGTTYTNSTGRPIFVSVVVSTTGPSTVAGGPVKLTVGASEYVGITPSGSGANWSLVVTGVIPPGANYSVSNSNSFTLNNWTELR